MTSRPILPIVPSPCIAVHGSDVPFQVRRIFCVGQNYADHAREMGSDPDRQEPFFFTKPADAVVPSGTELSFPARTQDLHHEVELVIAIAHGGSDILVEDAAAHIYGYAVGLDLTRRDLQAAAKSAGRPWDMAKGFDQSAPIGLLVEGQPPASGAIGLTIDGATRQSGDLSHMLWSVAEIISVLSTYVTLKPGDLIFTGTPSGVGPVRVGETVRGTILNIPPVEIRFRP